MKASVWTKEQTIDTIANAVLIFSDPKTTKDKFDLMEKVLGIAYVNCPEEMQNSVWMISLESTARRSYFESTIWIKDNCA